MLRGTSCRLSVRFCAVTTISSSDPEAVCWARAGPRQASIEEANDNWAVLIRRGPRREYAPDKRRSGFFLLIIGLPIANPSKPNVQASPCQVSNTIGAPESSDRNGRRWPRESVGGALRSFVDS